jgi:hypothetical protein
MMDPANERARHRRLRLLVRPDGTGARGDLETAERHATHAARIPVNGPEGRAPY